MTEEDIRRKTCLIVKRGNEYLVGTIMHTTELKWSLSKWDAWSTRNRTTAEKVASFVEGEVMMFNPIVGQTRALLRRSV